MFFVKKSAFFGEKFCLLGNFLPQSGSYFEVSSKKLLEKTDFFKFFNLLKIKILDLVVSPEIGSPSPFVGRRKISL